MIKEKWNIDVINQTPEGVLVMAPNGDTHYMTREEYESYKNKTKENDRSN